MYLDLEYRIRTDGEFRYELSRRLKQLQELDDLSRRDPGLVNAFHQAFYDLVKLCNFNLAPLVPYYWRKYPKDSPLHFADFPFAYQLFSYQPGGFIVCRASRQVSKTTALACRQWLMARLFRAFKSLYIVPRSDQLKTYQNRFREIERANYFYRPGSKLRQNLGYKEFANGSVIEMASVLTTAAGIRGKSCDEVIFDEFQNFDPDLQLEVMQTQAASPIKITIFSGTSLTTESALEQRWVESSQGSWVTKCDCGHWNIPLLEHGALDMIQPQGPSCAKCGRILDVRTGKFVHANLAAFEAGYRGFHIPQIVVPGIIYNPMRWADIYTNKIRTGANRKFLQEVMGIATEEGEKEITRQQLKEICILGNNTNELLRKAAQGHYKWVVSGCDWGGSDHIRELRIRRSTTVHTVLGVLANGDLDILYFRRYEGMDYDSITKDILHMHKLYGGYAIASDFGVGAVYNSGLRKEIAVERHLIFNYVGPSSPLLSAPENCPEYNLWSLNKSESISLTFDAVRRKRIRCFDFALAETYLQDFLNLFRAPGERSQQSGSSAGATTFIYRPHPTKPNDALMAVNYAYMLAKLLLGEAMLADLSVKIRLENSLLTGGYGVFPNLPGAFSE